MHWSQSMWESRTVQRRGTDKKMGCYWQLSLCLVLFYILAVEASTKSAPDPSNRNTVLPPQQQQEDFSRVLTYLQNEQAAVTSAQYNLLQFLRQRKVPIGQQPGSLRPVESTENEQSRIVTSTVNNNIECRISFDRVPLGHKCIAPCQCMGSQKWVQFSVMNKLRRKDPAAWVTCPTCRTPFRYDLFFTHAGIVPSLIGALLDNMAVLRALIAIVTVVLGEIAHIRALIMSYLVSRSFWQLVSPPSIPPSFPLYRLEPLTILSRLFVSSRSGRKSLICLSP